MSEAVYVGMDLGSFKTSVTSSNGRRAELYSAVGRPKDHVARALLGRDVVFGDEIVQQRLALNVVRPFEKGVLKYLDMPTESGDARKVQQHKDAARLLVQHAVSLTRPVEGAKVFGVVGAPSRASVLNKQVLLEASAGTFDAVVIVPEPFTVAYGMDRLTDTLVVDIGAGTIDLCPMCGTYPNEEDQVTLPIGGDAIDERFHELLTQCYPEVRVSRNMIREIKEKYGFVHDVEEQAIVTLPTDRQPKPFDVSGPLKEACQIIVEPIIEGLRELMSRFDPEFQDVMLKNILLGGGGSRLKGLDRLIEEALKDYGGGKVTVVYDSVYAGAAGALKLAMNMPADYWGQLLHSEPICAAA